MYFPRQKFGIFKIFKIPHDSSLAFEKNFLVNNLQKWKHLFEFVEKHFPYFFSFFLFCHVLMYIYLVSCCCSVVFVGFHSVWNSINYQLIGNRSINNHNKLILPLIFEQKSVSALATEERSWSWLCRWKMVIKQVVHRQTMIYWRWWNGEWGGAESVGGTKGA